VGDHWIDVFVAALLAVAGYLMRRDITAMDRRHERAENKFEKVDGTLGDHETRLTVIEDREDREDRDERR
jgi:hypothetical protein